MRISIIKRLGAAGCAAILAAVASGCSDKEASSSSKLYETPATQAAAQGDDVSAEGTEFSYTVTINGEDITFPVKISDLKASGWEVESENSASGYYVKNNTRMLVRMCEEKDGDYLSYGMSFMERTNKDASYEFKYGPIQMGVSTKEDVEAAFGTPDKIGEIGEYFYFKYPSSVSDGMDYAETRGHLGFGFSDSGIVDKFWLMD